jgi:hypothetical protein
MNIFIFFKVKKYTCAASYGLRNRENGYLIVVPHRIKHCAASSTSRTMDNFVSHDFQLRMLAVASL